MHEYHNISRIMLHNKNTIISTQRHPVAGQQRHKEGPPGQKAMTAGSRRDRSHHESHEERCEGCGKTGHTRDECILKDHPNWNKQVGVSWKDYKAGQHWAVGWQHLAGFPQEPWSLEALQRKRNLLRARPRRGTRGRKKAN